MPTVNLIPNFTNMRKQFERDAKNLADRIARRMRTEGEIDACDVRSLIVSMGIALQSVDTTGALEEHREFSAEIVAQIAEANDHFVNEGGR